MPRGFGENQLLLSLNCWEICLKTTATDKRRIFSRRFVVKTFAMLKQERNKIARLWSRNNVNNNICRNNNKSRINNNNSRSRRRSIRSIFVAATLAASSSVSSSATTTTFSLYLSLSISLIIVIIIIGYNTPVTAY
jgi:hypothetical protein